MKNISEEIEDYSPQNTLNARDQKSSGPSPVATLSKQLQQMTAQAVAQRGPMGNIKKKSTTNTEVKNKVVSPKSIPVQENFHKKCSPTTNEEEIVKMPKSHNISISSESSISSRGSLAAPRRASQPNVPTIQISRTESQLEKKPKPMENPSSRKNSIKSLRDGIFDCNFFFFQIIYNSFSDPQPLKSTAVGSAPKVVKRKAPNPSNESPDISISRPVAPKPLNGQGLIPPPPETNTETEKEEPISSATTETKQIIYQTNSQIVETPITILPPSSPDIDNIPTGSSEKLITTSMESMVTTIDTASSGKILQANSPVHSPAPSPKCLRPYRKIEDVTTVKRQQKTGWL